MPCRGQRFVDDSRSGRPPHHPYKSTSKGRTNCMSTSNYLWYPSQLSLIHCLKQVGVLFVFYSQYFVSLFPGHLAGTHLSTWVVSEGNYTVCALCLSPKKRTHTGQGSNYRPSGNDSNTFRFDFDYCLSISTFSIRLCKCLIVITQKFTNKYE